MSIQMFILKILIRSFKNNSSAKKIKIPAKAGVRGVGGDLTLIGALPLAAWAKPRCSHSPSASKSNL